MPIIRPSNSRSVLSLLCHISHFIARTISGTARNDCICAVFNAVRIHVHCTHLVVPVVPVPVHFAFWSLLTCSNFFWCAVSARSNPDYTDG